VLRVPGLLERQAVCARIGHSVQVQVGGLPWEGLTSFDGSLVPRSESGIVLCPEPCALRGACRLGILVERLDRENSAYFEIVCPPDHREGPNLAHGTWTAAILSEMCGILPVLLGTVAFLGTVTVRFEAPVPLGERLIGRATLDGRERRKLFVSGSLSSSTTGAELAKASTIMIALQVD
jgi:acyl-coenzyme A thioesterase PaaI-like protein